MPFERLLRPRMLWVTSTARREQLHGFPIVICALVSTWMPFSARESSGNPGMPSRSSQYRAMSANGGIARLGRSGLALGHFRLAQLAVHGVELGPDGLGHTSGERGVAHEPDDA